MKKLLEKTNQIFPKMLRTEIAGGVSILIAYIVIHFILKKISMDTRGISILLLSVAALSCQIIFCKSFIRSYYEADGLGFKKLMADYGNSTYVGILSDMFRLVKSEGAVLLTATGTALLTVMAQLLYEYLPSLLSTVFSAFTGMDTALLTAIAQLLTGFLFLLISAIFFKFNGVGTVISFLLMWLGVSDLPSTVIGAVAGTVEFSVVYLLILALKRSKWIKEGDPRLISRL